jgi:hypothetical protein
VRALVLERCYLVRVEPFEPVPRLDLAVEHVTDLRWWAAVGSFLASGPPTVPLELGK